MVRMQRMSWAVALLWLGTAPGLVAQPTQGVFSLPVAGQVPDKRYLHGCAVVGNRLYVFGGMIAGVGWAKDVKSAEIGPDARLGAWRDEQPLPLLLAYITQAVQVVNNRLYVVGGSTHPDLTASDELAKQVQEVVWTSVGANGVLDPWKRGAPFPGVPLSCTATCADEKHLFVLGGHNTEPGINIVSDAVVVADFAEDGTPVNWRQSAKLPTPLWFHGAAILDSTMYVWGGLSTQKADSVNPKVFAGRVAEGGTIAEWRADSQQMPWPVYSAAFCGFNDYLVCIAGRYKDAVPHNAIWYSHVRNGQLEKWQFLNTDLLARLYVPLGLDRTKGWVFIPAGLDRRTKEVKAGEVVDRVQCFQLTQPRDSKLVVSPSPQAAEPVLGASTAGLKICTMEQATEQAKKSGKPILVFFYSREVPACKRTWQNVIASPAFAAILRDSPFVPVNVSAGGMSLCYRYGIFKVPSLAQLSASGELQKKIIRLDTPGDLQPLQGTP